MPWASGAGSTVTVGRSMSAIASGRVRGLSRWHGNGRDWATPPEIFDPLHAEFAFTLDPCARPETAKLPRYYTEADDGLSRSWQDERVFMNPPYGREIYAWTTKAAAEARGSALVVGLLPASTDLAWFHDDVVAEGAEVRFIRGRVRFVAPGGTWASGMFASIVVVWRPRGA